MSEILVNPGAEVPSVHQEFSGWGQLTRVSFCFMYWAHPGELFVE